MGSDKAQCARSAHGVKQPSRLQEYDMRQRLDYVLVSRGLVKSRSRARDLIARGAISVAGQPAVKAGQLVEPDVALSIDEEANAFVARSGVKLVAGLRGFELSPEGRVALDVGASTGGFTQVLLEHGALRVYAVDVGHGQLEEVLGIDPRVISLEGRDVRRLTAQEVPEKVSAIVVDVSFISLAQVLPAALAFAAPNCWLVALVKPQFEVGQKAIGKGGVVRDEDAVIHAVERTQNWLIDHGWRVLGALSSPLPGKKGNAEYLVGAVLNG
jgi:23S rRNA (cytidine1920-2'-O)/16S rRNA (cytidine1409-2'-O)-methyltransferase